MQEILQYTLEFAKKILAIPSPSGYTQDAIAFVESEAARLGFSFERTKKGNTIVTVPGASEKRLGLSGHVDTLGAMVKSVKGSGDLKFTTIGGPIWPTLDGEYCQVKTRDGKIYTGTFLSESPSSHVYKDASTSERTPEKMYIRLDERIASKSDAEQLGIRPGDFVFFDPKTVITPSGFIKSRFLDDKISVSILFGLLFAIKSGLAKPQPTLKIIISTYEEVGHGASWVPELDELLAVDMGCIGDDLSCTEQMVSICCKDSSGPYDDQMTSKLVRLAEQNKLGFATDIYPFYGSDVSAALRGGNDLRGALIGPGVHASHGMERTHIDALENTLRLLLAYISC
ncbi:MAG: M42 family metallopeptidase [Bacillus subtilis]|nr:M42 family metallopeptidase [Bacillus subtilis]